MQQDQILLNFADKLEFESICTEGSPHRKICRQSRADVDQTISYIERIVAFQDQLASAFFLFALSL